MKKREVKRPEREVFAGQVDKEPGTCFPLYLFCGPSHFPAAKKDAAAIRANCGNSGTGGRHGSPGNGDEVAVELIKGYGNRYW